MTNDISELLNRIQMNIRAAEAGNTDASLLEEVRADYLALMELLKLFLISERDTYYGYILMNMQFGVDFAADCIAGIKLNTFPPVLEANPLLLCKFTLREILFIICHEIDHMVFNHPSEMVKTNPDNDPDTFYRFNLAADAAVNDGIQHEIDAEGHAFLSMPAGAIMPDTLEKQFGLRGIRRRENYAYYFELIRSKEKGKQNGAQQNGQSSMMQQQNRKDGIRQSAGGDANDGDSDTQNTQGNSDNAGKGERTVTATNCGNLKDHQWEAGDDAEDATAAARELVNAAVDMMNSEKRGLMPGRFMDQVEKLNTPPVLSWQAILKKYVGTITANKKKTRTRLNRRQPERFDLSGRMDDKVLKIVVAIDTSGSMDNKTIAKVFNEIFAILAKRRHEITVIECDAKIGRAYRARTPADIKMKVTGRGGTCFTPVIEYINSDRYFRDALMIYFTDGYGEREIPRPRTYRNMWVVLGDARHLSVKEPYGAVLSLQV